jgi:Mg-chelatase subunit ChlD
MRLAVLDIKGRIRRRERGFVAIFLAIALMMLMAAVGLATDTAVLYVVRSKLTAACDGASLAAARNLNLGLTMAEQTDNAKALGQSFYEANFPQGYLNATRNPATIVIPASPPGQVLTVSTTGSATVRTYFMHLFGFKTVEVAASGTASRRAVNLMIVLDRSNSMNNSGSCEPMKKAAVNFVNNFADGRDNVGLITFGTNMKLAFPPKDNFKSAATSVTDLIESITCNHNTAVTMAYWAAYKELEKIKQPSALNAIVLFTDGVPNGIYANFPVKELADKRFGSSDTDSLVSVPKSSCTATSVTGVIAQEGGFDTTGATIGVVQKDAVSITNHKEYQVSSSNCKFPSSRTRMREDIAYIPDIDADGNRLRGYGYDYYKSTDFPTSEKADQNVAAYKNMIRVDRPWTLAKASCNFLDHAAIRVRDRVLNANIGVVTYVIGLGSYSLPVKQQPDDELMMRVANDPRSSIYVKHPETPDGIYIRAEDTMQMADAFHRIASEVLRISR